MIATWLQHTISQVWKTETLAQDCRDAVFLFVKKEGSAHLS